jgi:hypothetical protein
MWRRENKNIDIGFGDSSILGPLAPGLRESGLND